MIHLSVPAIDALFYVSLRWLPTKLRQHLLSFSVSSGGLFVVLGLESGGKGFTFQVWVTGSIIFHGLHLPFQ